MDLRDLILILIWAVLVPLAYYLSRNRSRREN